MQNDHKVKAMFTDNKGKEIKELIYTYNDGDPKDLLINLQKQL